MGGQREVAEKTRWEGINEDKVGRFQIEEKYWGRRPADTGSLGRGQGRSRQV